MTNLIRLLISRPDRIGDVVMSTPMPREIKKRYPDAFIAVLVRSYTKDLFLHNPYVDKIIVFDEDTEGGKKNFDETVSAVRECSINCALMLLPSKSVNSILFRAGVRLRIGTGHKLYQFLFNVKSTYRNKYIPLRHEADYCMDAARKIGVDTANIDTEIYLSEEEKSTVEKLKEKYSAGGRRVIGIHSTSGNSAPNLTPAEYRRLVDGLLRNKDLSVIITDNDPPEELSGIQGVIYPNTGLDLRNSILNFASLDLLISASTGPMHIAAALKVDTLSLFCPLTACSPKLWGPKGNRAEVMLPPENYCSVKCPGDPKICRFEGGGISASDVMKRIER